MVLLPKVEGAYRIDQYWPIKLGNFLFKIIIKILVTRMGALVGDVMSINQFGFIKGRSIHHCIVLTSNMVNLLVKSSIKGNMAIKVDIKKAFNTMEWSFF